MARRDLTGAVDFSVLEAATAGMDDISEEVLGLFVYQASLWSPMLTTDQAGWRDAAHTLRGAGGGIGAKALAEVCAEAEAADDPLDLPDLGFDACAVLVADGDGRGQIAEGDMVTAERLKRDVSVCHFVVGVTVEQLDRLVV